MLLAVNHGVNFGFLKTVFSGLGNLTGNLLMALVSIVGLGALLITSGFIFTILKWAGILYLLFIGIKIILAPIKHDIQNESQLPKKRSGAWRLFIDGFIIAIGNPKGILFFTALFPQFINLEKASIDQFIVIFLTLGSVALGCYMTYALCGVKLSRLFRLHSFRKIFNRLTGSVFIGTSVVLAFSRK
jgi:threonine/homoserine/homoserine lactone efflux protein